MSICKAELHIADDHQDNHATMRCQLDADHPLPHIEIFTRDGTDVTITWFVDQREVEIETLQKLREALAELIDEGADAQTRARWEGYFAQDFVEYGLGPCDGESVADWANRIRAEAAQNKDTP